VRLYRLAADQGLQAAETALCRYSYSAYFVPACTLRTLRDKRSRFTVLTVILYRGSVGRAQSHRPVLGAFLALFGASSDSIASLSFRCLQHEQQ